MGFPSWLALMTNLAWYDVDLAFFRNSCARPNISGAFSLPVSAGAAGTRAAKFAPTGFVPARRAPTTTRAQPMSTVTSKRPFFMLLSSFRVEILRKPVDHTLKLEDGIRRLDR